MEESIKELYFYNVEDKINDKMSEPLINLFQGRE